MEILFEYNSKKKQHFINLFLMSTGLLLMVPAVLVFGKLPNSAGPDAFIFLALAVGFLLPALGFVLFGLFRYIRHRIFYKQQPWTGIRVLPNRKLVCSYFNHWKVKTIEADLTRLVRWSIQSNRGQRFLLLEIDARPGKLVIPVHNAKTEELNRLTGTLFSDNREPLVFESGETEISRPQLPGFLTEERVRVAEALIRSIELKLQLSMLRKVFVLNEKEVCIGGDSDETELPKIRVRWIGEGFGDSYSGYYAYQMVYQLENGPKQADGRNFRLDYHFEATDLAGSTSHFVSRMEEAEEQLFENGFYEILQSGFEMAPFDITGNNIP